jgi:hypothetical protein
VALRKFVSGTYKLAENFDQRNEKTNFQKKNNMGQQVKIRILKLLSLLTEEQKTKDIIEIDETNNENLVSFLKNDGLLAFDYEIEYENLKPFISEKSGTINLWHKNFNGTWTINLYYINRIIKVN